MGDSNYKQRQADLRLQAKAVTVLGVSSAGKVDAPGAVNRAEVRYHRAYQKELARRNARLKKEGKAPLEKLPDGTFIWKEKRR